MERRVVRIVFAVVCAAVAAAAGGCSGSSTPVSSTPTPTLNPEPFNGVIKPLGTDSHTFMIAYTGPSDASITITSLATVANNTPQAITLGVGFGTTNLGVCTLSTIQNPTAPLNTELATTGAPFTAGTYCVEVFDNTAAPTVTEPMNYSLVVKHF